jgi:hypothetical protein
MEFFTGGEMVEPGLVNVVDWPPGPGAAPTPTRIHALAGVGRKL